mmetsp:Transcript_94289/g.224516  ORF Transcript_94289/g.224516 Transcript_94289/m.224516 type:complete len:237 (-) Transcript_94289:1349-2059(-)
MPAAASPGINGNALQDKEPLLSAAIVSDWKLVKLGVNTGASADNRLNVGGGGGGVCCGQCGCCVAGGGGGTGGGGGALNGGSGSRAFLEASATAAHSSRARSIADCRPRNSRALARGPLCRPVVPPAASSMGACARVVACHAPSEHCSAVRCRRRAASALSQMARPSNKATKPCLPVWSHHGGRSPPFFPLRNSFTTCSREARSGQTPDSRLRADNSVGRLRPNAPTATFRRTPLR